MEYSAKEVFNLYNSLVCIPSIIKNKSALIFLRNDTWVAGVVVDADGSVVIFETSVEMSNILVLFIHLQFHEHFFRGCSFSRSERIAV